MQVTMTVNREQVTANLLDAPCDSIAMERPEHVKGLENHQCQRALLDIFFLLHVISSHAVVLVTNTRMPDFHWESNRSKSFAPDSGGHNLLFARFAVD